MGNSTECCSDGVLVPGRFTYPISFNEGIPEFGGAMQTTGNNGNIGNIIDQGGDATAAIPAVPAMAPPAANMDGISVRTTAPGSGVQDDGPLAKDGYFVSRDTTLTTGPFNLPPMVFEQAVDRGTPYGPFKFNQTRHTYCGEWKRHKFHGQGILFFENGDYVAGTFRNGSPIARCRLMLFSQNCYYEGQMKNWHAEGQGVFFMLNGSYSYRGRFHSSNADGYGLEQTPQSKFQGVFKNACKVKGVLTTKNGYIYDGEFYDDKFHGFGKLISPNGEYNGEFNNGRKSGTGIFKWKDGSYYEGEYKNDQKHGKGKYVSADRKTVHDGQWRNGKFIGTQIGGVIVGKSTRSTLSPRSHLSSASTISRSSTPPIIRPSAPILTGVSAYKSNSSLTNSSKYVPASTLLAPSNYLPATTNYVPPAITVTSASQYVPTTVLGNSNFISKTSNYAPAVLTGGSNLSFRGSSK